MRKYLNDYREDKDNKAGAINKIGNIFQGYVFNYIKTISSKYKQFEIINFDKTFIDENTKKKLDIDFVLSDKVRNKYFLIQILFYFIRYRKNAYQAKRDLASVYKRNLNQLNACSLNLVLKF